jgi:hypothetical protein
MSIEETTNLKKYAHVLDGKVVNVSVWDGQATYESEEELIEVPNNSLIGVGWDYSNGDFSDNRPTTNIPE